MARTKIVKAGLIQLEESGEGRVDCLLTQIKAESDQPDYTVQKCLCSAAGNDTVSYIC